MEKFSYLAQYINEIKSLWGCYSQMVTWEEHMCFCKIKDRLTYGNEEMKWLAYEMESLIQNEKSDEWGFKRKVYVYSFLISVMRSKKHAMELLQMLMEEERLDAEVGYYLHFQLIWNVFLGKIEDDLDLKVMMYRFLRKIDGEFKRGLPHEMIKIPKQERDHNMVLVIADQFLGLEHEPTKSALARCAAIKRRGKKVLLINTAELGAKSGEVPGFDFYIGNYWEKNSALNEVEWQGIKIPFFQCDNNMPNVDDLGYLLDVVRQKLKPYYAIAIGGESIFASMLQEMIPVLAVGMVPSDIEISLVNYQTLGRKMNERDFEYLQRIGKSKGQIIEHKFTSDLREQKVILNREEIGIGDEFVIAVVGHRLEEEITDDFWEMLEGVLAEEPVMVLLLGSFGKKQEVIEKHPILEGAIQCEGKVTEVLAYMELCDLYVNPIRTGGGISCVEAMIKGVPVVTTSKGDVGLNAGESFAVKDYREMKQAILRYIQDIEFYVSQSEKAIQRAKELTDTDQAFWDVICEFMKRTGLE